MKQKMITVWISIAVTTFAHAQATKTSLYDKIGIHKFAQGADNCIEMEFADPMLLKNEMVKTEADTVPRAVVKFGLTGYLAHLAGGPQMPSVDIAALDKALNMTKEQRDHSWMLREKAFVKAGFSKKDFLDLKALYLKKFNQASPMLPGKEMFKDETSLYARLGGFMPISMVVNDFIDALATDKTVMSNQRVVKSLTTGKATAAGLKYLVTEQLAMAAGGPFKYSGRSMKDSHKDLAITESEWQSSAAILKKVLDTYKVPVKEQGEIFSVIASTHGDIVKK